MHFAVVADSITASGRGKLGSSADGRGRQRRCSLHNLASAGSNLPATLVFALDWPES